MNIKLLVEAFQILDGIPKKWFDLDEFVTVNKATCNLPAPSTGEPIHCGTIGCALGWLALHPTFSKKTGLQWDARDAELLLRGNKCSFIYAGARVFDIPEYDAFNLFKPALGNERFSCSNESRLSDKEIWKGRCRAILRKHGALLSRKQNG